ncbi:hypothetical protein QQS21_008645 [Conoideocrella luteorostrata]|uniref:Fucose-specific lectin n=1 Tax=Conoideocrella luteorostrata TaxID=1105319 RepID=A0AAJ0CIG7_9HYPO|nr:hypothetical protein QQS21_008645 [Conoideocrella luteorostrata]
MAPPDIPWLSYQHRQNNMAERSIPLDTLPPPPEYNKHTRDGPETVHNHYHIGNEASPLPWYRRKWVFWTVLGLVAFLVVAGLIILGVVLKVQMGKNSMGGHISPVNSTSTVVITSTAVSTEKATSTTTSHHSSSTSTATTSTEAQTTATPFTMSEKSQLASVYVGAKDSKLSRRLLVRQEDTNDILVTEWANGQLADYRIKDRLGSLPTEPKLGTPLALQADDAGTLHLFYLSKANILSYLYEPSVGKWKTGEVSSEHGAIRTSAYSGLSAAWHNGRKASGLLVVAYDNSSQKLQLAMTSSPSERNSWYIADVTSVEASSAAGDSTSPCYSLAGDWLSLGPQKEDGRFQHLLIAIADANEVTPWECAVDFWPPPEVQVKCKQANESFRDSDGRALTMVPPPKQFSWIRQKETRDSVTGKFDFTLLSLDVGGAVHEDSVGAGGARDTGQGFAADSPITAISATAEGIVFASSGKDVYTYRKHGSRWQPDVADNVTFQA